MSNVPLHFTEVKLVAMTQRHEFSNPPPPCETTSIARREKNKMKFLSSFEDRRE
jgi:hypothetical protein